MELSVVIPCHNATGFLSEQLDALSDQSTGRSWEVIIADNGSNAGLVEILEGYRGHVPGLRLIEATRKKGAAYARNAGAHHARGRNVAFLDADDVVDESWVDGILKALERCEFVASRLEFGKLNSQELIRAQGNSQNRGLMDFSVVRFLPFASTCGLAVRKDIHDSVGGFDETMKYVEDAEYCWRLQLLGYELCYAEDAVVHFRFRETLWQSFRQAMNYGEYDVLLYKKYKEHKIPLQNRRRSIGDWKKLAVGINSVLRSDGRRVWVRSLGKKLGRLKGSAKYGIFVP